MTSILKKEPLNWDPKESLSTGDPVVDNYRPRTELGFRLLALRRTFIEGGGTLLDDTALEAEFRDRRGGADA